MNDARDKMQDTYAFGFSAAIGGADRRRAAIDFTAVPRQDTQAALRSPSWQRQCERWRCLMMAAQGGETLAYERLLQELNAWLRGYYARRLPGPAAEDARQEALLAIHLGRDAYLPSRSFGAWVCAIARHKWIDRVRNAYRSDTLSIHDDVPVPDHGEAVISAAVIDNLLGRLKPAQANVIRLVKLQGFSIEGASSATGQSAALVKVNIHRGLKRLASLVAGDSSAPSTSASMGSKGPSAPAPHLHQ